jgi:hypothetical protein
MGQDGMGQQNAPSVMQFVASCAARARAIYASTTSAAVHSPASMRRTISGAAHHARIISVDVREGSAGARGVREKWRGREQRTEKRAGPIRGCEEEGLLTGRADVPVVLRGQVRARACEAPLALGALALHDALHGTLGRAERPHRVCFGFGFGCPWGVAGDG